MGIIVALDHDEPEADCLRRIGQARTSDPSNIWTHAED